MRTFLKLFFTLAFFALFIGNGFAEEVAKDVSSIDLSGIESVLKMVLDFLFEKFGIAGSILGGLAALIVTGRAYILFSPSKKDDAWLQKMESKPWIGMIFRILAAFSPVQRKDK